MMNKILIRLLTLCLCLCMVSAMVPAALAYYVDLPYLVYTVEGGEAYVTGIEYEQYYVGSVFDENPLDNIKRTIETTYNGYPVVGIKAGALMLNESWEAQFFIPPCLTKIEEGAIGGSSIKYLTALGDPVENPVYLVEDNKIYTADKTVLLASATVGVIPGTVTRVGAKVFSGMGSGTFSPSITFQGDAPEFAPDAFENSRLNVIYNGGCKGWATAVQQNYGATSVTWTNNSDCAKHSFSEGVVSLSPGCVTAGLEKYTCSICSYSYEKSLPAVGHSFENGTCGVCGKVDPDFTTPVITLKYPTLSFEDDIKLNIYFETANLEDAIGCGLLLYHEPVNQWTVDNADEMIPGWTWDESAGLYCVTGGGFAAKELSDKLYFAVYALLADGTYCYSDLKSYSPEEYAYAQIATGTQEMKELMIAMLNFGTEAQLYFGYNTHTLANRNLTEAQKGMIEAYRSDMVQALPEIDMTSVGGVLDETRITGRSRTVSFESAFCVNYYLSCTPFIGESYDVAHWSNEAFENNKSNLSSYGAYQVCELTKIQEETSDTPALYQCQISGIPAKDIGKPLYVALETTRMVDMGMPGIRYYVDLTDLQNYSIGTYCNNIVAKGDAMAPLASATVVYGYYADLYFA